MRLSIGQSGHIFKLSAEISDCPQVIYSYDPVFHLALSNMAQSHVAFCQRHVALHQRHVALYVRHVAFLLFRQ